MFWVFININGIMSTLYWNSPHVTGQSWRCAWPGTPFWHKNITYTLLSCSKTLLCFRRSYLCICILGILYIELVKRTSRFFLKLFLSESDIFCDDDGTQEFNKAFVCPACKWNKPAHYNDVIMGTMASQITRLTIVYSTVYSGADQRKHQISASLAFMLGIHPAVTGEFPAQRASNAENVSIWWRHHVWFYA